MTPNTASAARAMTPTAARTGWNELPDQVRAAVESLTGEVHHVTTISSGLNAAFTARLSTHTGLVFAKGVPATRATAQRREAAINPQVQPIAPRLLWEIDTEGWHVLGFEHLDGRPADLRPTSTDLPAAAGVLGQLTELDAPDAGCKRIENRWADAAERAGANVRLLAGDHLLHTDLNPHNILITTTGPRIVDWSWPTLGAAWIDTACAALWLIAEGHSPGAAESWASGLPPWDTASTEELDAFTAINAALWGQIASADQRSWKQRIHEAAVVWCKYRTT
ncbi:MAG: hypothetical protein ACRDSK_06515 [Actinophytocola sp.]|uniref:hypothetical protein n=1 Tax=Actinophytocola sp. TaxID=1872138 RepID=UPI003D6A3104